MKIIHSAEISASQKSKFFSCLKVFGPSINWSKVCKRVETDLLFILNTTDIRNKHTQNNYFMACRWSQFASWCCGPLMLNEVTDNTKNVHNIVHCLSHPFLVHDTASGLEWKAANTVPLQ
jgi:hypothetical protein